ncbi:putative dioxygenase [Desulfamplus magnetovallimortis]|uniref:Putative dioxygenase n=1 Tax=Desulfamplus magnetovallimortis TaxID=1246637 RepID=A0A1W1HC07_9BACT|nr:PfaD family polyunsaturated fatty acid/polyketide biosynthesis protein [Desulfamplus magnetovallimortis]SLM30027.1 putative dioxygenase [Desulfamplus magnetovallimortis]
MTQLTQNLQGFWNPEHGTKSNPLPFSNGLNKALMTLSQPVYIIDHCGQMAVVTGGEAHIGKSSSMSGNKDSYGIVAFAPSLPLEHLGARSFKMRHNIKYPYIAGAMANGITSTQMVEAMAKNGMMGFFGSGGLSLSEVENAVIHLKKNLESLTPSLPWGINLIHSHGDPELEMAVVNLYIKHNVHCISAAAFMRITLPLVYYRLKGIHMDMEGRIITPNRMIAKVSRVEVARQFFSPPPEKMVSELFQMGLISQEEAKLSQSIPMAQDLTAEADSGGHTDNRPAIALLPTMLSLGDEFNEKFNYQEPLCVGLAGGISTPESTAAAFNMGAAYVLTGSINQSCIESGTSDTVRELLAQAEQADVAMAPAADMFEIGAKVQVLKRGTMFSVRADKLYHIYKNYDNFESVPEKIRKEIEEKFLQATFEQKWKETEAFFKVRNIKELQRAESDPRHKMALVFRSYLGLSSRWSIAGDPSRRMDYQIWCGPSMGAFNKWVKGSFLEKTQNRKVADVALNLLFGASICTRAGWLRNQGVDLPAGAGRFAPVDLERLYYYCIPNN